MVHYFITFQNVDDDMRCGLLSTKVGSAFEVLELDPDFPDTSEKAGYVRKGVPLAYAVFVLQVHHRSTTLSQAYHFQLLTSFSIRVSSG